MNKLLRVAVCMILASLALSAPGALDYRQREDLKNARFYKNEVEANAPDLLEAAAKLKAEGSAGKQPGDLQAGLNRIQKLNQRMTYIQNYLDKLPADEADVKAIADWHKDMLPKLAEAETIFSGAGSEAATLNSADSWPDLAADHAQIKDMARMLYDTQMFQTHPERAMSVCSQLGEMVKRRGEIAKKYDAILAQPLGVELANSIKYFDSNFTSFQTAVEQYKSTAPAEIDQHLADAAKMGQDAAQQKKPLFFTGGVPQRMGWAEEKIKILESIESAAPLAKAAREKYVACQNDLKKLEATLEQEIVRATTKPQDNYRGADRPVLNQAIEKEWKASYPQDQILGICIPTNEWERTTEWRLQNTTWYKVDYSWLQARIGVKGAGPEATIYIVNIYKDHMKNDAINYKLDDKMDVPVQRRMLAENWK